MEGKGRGKKKCAGEGKKVYQMEKAFPDLFQGGTSKKLFFPPLIHSRDGRTELPSKRISIIKDEALKQALEGSSVFGFAGPAVGVGIFKAKMLHIPDCPEGQVQFGMALVGHVPSGAHSTKGPFYLLFQVLSNLPQAPEINPGKFYVCGFVWKNFDWEVVTDPDKVVQPTGFKTEVVPTTDYSQTLSGAAQPDANMLPCCQNGVFDQKQGIGKTESGLPTTEKPMKIEKKEETQDDVAMEGVDSGESSMDVDPGDQEILEACPAQTDTFKEAGNFWLQICKIWGTFDESLPIDCFMNYFLRGLMNTIKKKAVPSLVHLLVNEENVITCSAFTAFWTLCISKRIADEDNLEQLSQSSCFLAISLGTAETLLRSYPVQPEEALWLVRYSLRKPGVLFLSWSNDKGEVSHEEISYTKDKKTQKITGFSLGTCNGMTLQELANKALANQKRIAVPCPMTWLERITASCQLQLHFIMNDVWKEFEQSKQTDDTHV